MSGSENLFDISQDFVDGILCFDTLPHNGIRGSEWSYTKVSGAVQSSVKASEDGDVLMIRIFNPKDHAETVSTTPPIGTKCTKRYTLAEEEIEMINPASFLLQGGEIATIGLVF